MAVMLELSDQELETTMNNMLRTQMGGKKKKKAACKNRQNNQKNSKKDAERITGDQKHCNRNKCLQWAH